MKNTANQKATILQVPFFAQGRAAALEILLGYLHKNTHHLVVTPNPEGLMEARRDGDFLRILQQAQLVLPDGIGVVLAAKWRKTPLRRVTGCDLTLALLEAAAPLSAKVYLLGAAPGVAETAGQKLAATYPGLQIVGARDGYFDANGEILILEDIKAQRPDILLVGMGMPRQEKWASAHLQALPCKITLCVGGTLDILAGKVRRAPRIFQRLGLEWLYRLLSQPSRAKRMLDLPRFVWTVLRADKEDKNVQM